MSNCICPINLCDALLLSHTGLQGDCDLRRADVTRRPAPPPKQLIFCAHTGGARSLVPRRMRLRSGIPRHRVVQSVESLDETCRLFNASHDA